MSLQVLPEFTVIDESPDWIVVDKAAPLIVHPTNGKNEPTLLGGIDHLLAFEIENGACPAVVNRLDRDTSGLVLVAKHKQAARALGMAFEARQVEKEYLAVVGGWPIEDRWTCAEPIRRQGVTRESKIWVRQVVDPQGKPCCTHFEVLDRFMRDDQRYALVRCLPETGRMHQLRVHLAHCGHPIVGDKLYWNTGAEYIRWMEAGWTEELKQMLHLPRHALHASLLRLRWEGHEYVWRCDLPGDIEDFIAGRPVREVPGVVIWSRHGRHSQ